MERFLKVTNIFSSVVSDFKVARSGLGWLRWRRAFPPPTPPGAGHGDTIRRKPVRSSVWEGPAIGDCLALRQEPAPRKAALASDKPMHQACAFSAPGSSSSSELPLDRASKDGGDQTDTGDTAQAQADGKIPGRQCRLAG